MAPLISIKNVTLPPPSADDRRPHDQRLTDALGLGAIEIPLSVMRRLPAQIRAAGSFPCIIGSRNGRHVLVDIGTGRSFSVALDIGTTNLVGQLYDNAAGREVLVRSRENPQIVFGSDIMTRLHRTLTGDRQEVHDVLVNGVNDLIEMLCREARINTQEIHGLSIAGNTVMTHYFLGLDVSTIPVEPFIPVVRNPGFFAAAELSLGVSPEAVVFVFPNAGSYVGGDITAGILASGLFRMPETSILIDVGTNAEVVVGNKDWMIVGAGAAGPALEEGIIAIGKRAATGIVYDVAIDDQGIRCKTFDQAAPGGICGSGMVSLLFELHRAGIVDPSGTLADDDRVIPNDGDRAFRLACDGHEPLLITQNEIRNFLKSKAAMFTLLLALTRSVGISFSDIGRVFVSGALGTGIDARKAVGIGMLPAWPAEIVTPLGNSSLAGCRMLLEDADLASEADALVHRITYKPMQDDPEFMKEFLGAVFIPHTNPSLLAVDTAEERP